MAECVFSSHCRVEHWVREVLKERHWSVNGRKSDIVDGMRREAVRYCGEVVKAFGGAKIWDRLPQYVSVFEQVVHNDRVIESPPFKTSIACNSIHSLVNRLKRICSVQKLLDPRRSFAYHKNVHSPTFK